MASNMSNECIGVIFSDRAYNAIIRETFEWDPVETGGILLGHILDNGYWIVMEVLPPGYGESREGDNVFHEMGYFEYNQKFVNYLAHSVANQYEIPLELLGLWHRHPGSMNVFSHTDDGTNTTFARLNPHGAISGLINVDPQLRMTMYHLPNNAMPQFGRPPYEVVDVEVGSELIPEEYFRLKYYNGEEKDLHPYAPVKNHRTSKLRSYEEDGTTNYPTQNGHVPGTTTGYKVYGQPARREDKVKTSKEESLSNWEDWMLKLKKKRNLILLILCVIIFLLSLMHLKRGWNKESMEIIDQQEEMINLQCDSI